MSKFETTGIHLKRAILLYATDLEHHTALDEIVKGHSAPPLSVKLPDQYFIEFVWQSVTYRKKIGKMYTKYSHHKAVSTSCGENVWILCWQSHDWKSCQLNYQYYWYYPYLHVPTFSLLFIGVEMRPLRWNFIVDMWVDAYSSK